MASVTDMQISGNSEYDAVASIANYFGQFGNGAGGSLGAISRQRPIRRSIAQGRIEAEFVRTRCSRRIRRQVAMEKHGGMARARRLRRRTRKELWIAAQWQPARNRWSWQQGLFV